MGDQHDPPPTPGVLLETLEDPDLYTVTQLQQACDVTRAIGRRTLVLLEPPMDHDAR